MSFYCKCYSFISFFFVITIISSCSTEEAITGCPVDSIEVDSLSDNFENGLDLDKWDISSLDPDRLDAVEIIDDVNEARKGNFAAKFTIYPGDVAANGNRAEMVVRGNVDRNCSEGYYAWSFKLDKNYQPIIGSQTTGQFHTSPDIEAGEVPWNYDVKKAPNPVSLQYGRLGSNNLELVLLPIGGGERNIITISEIQPGVWVDLIFHIKWSMFNDGFIEGWVNGNHFTPYNEVARDYKVYGANVVNKAGNYLKIGTYRDIDAENVGVVWYDEVMKGNSIDEVTLQ